MEAFKSFLQGNSPKLIVGGAVVVIGVPLLKLLCSRRRKIDIAKFPRDKVILFQLPRGPFAPSLSPYCLKLETYLRMANIPYQNEFGLIFSSKQKIPFIVFGGEEVADSHFCMEHLNRARGLDLSSWLSDEDRAVARAFRLMAEDHMFWALALCRWCFGQDDPQARVFQEAATYGQPRLITHLIRRTIRRQAHAQGIGRHTEQEVMNLGEGDIRAISVFLGKKAFLMGDEPCEEDASIFGMLAQIYWQCPGPVAQLLREECRNVGDYCERMKERFWPDWDECITFGGTKTTSK